MEQLHDRFIEEPEEFESRPSSQTNLIKNDSVSKRGSSGLAGFENLATQSAHTIQDAENSIELNNVDSDDQGLVLKVDIRAPEEQDNNNNVESAPGKEEDEFEFRLKNSW